MTQNNEEIREELIEYQKAKYAVKFLQNKIKDMQNTNQTLDHQISEKLKNIQELLNKEQKIRSKIDQYDYISAQLNKNIGIWKGECKQFDDQSIQKDDYNAVEQTQQLQQ